MLKQMDFKDRLVKMPPFAAKKIRSIFERLWAAHSELSHVKDVEDRKEQWLHAASHALVGKHLQETVRVLRVSVLDDDWTNAKVMRQSFYRLAANYERIRAGLAVPNRGDGVLSHMAYARLVYVTRRSDDKDDDNAKLVYHVESGPLAGKIIEDVIKIRAARWHYFAMVGPVRRCGYKTPYQLAGLRCVLTVEAGLSGTKIERVSVTQSLLTKNVALVRKRSRACTPCPYGMSVDCFRCRVGTNECGLAVLPIITNFLQVPSDPV